MKDSKDCNDKFIGKIRLFLSVSFALFIYLPVYIILRDIRIIFITLLIIGYYFLYNRLWLRRFIYKQNKISFYWILLFYLLTASLIGALLWWVFTADTYISFLFRDVGILFIAFLIALIVGYYFLYNPLWLRRFIYKEISFYWILLFYLFVTSLTGTLLWWVPTADVYISFGVGPLCAFLGAVLGFIFGLMGSMVIVIFKIKNSRKRWPKDGSKPTAILGELKTLIKSRLL